MIIRIFSLAILIVTFNVVNNFAQEVDVRNIDFVSGVYLDIEEFLKNEPIKCDTERSLESVETGFEICEKSIYCQSGEVLKSTEVWGLCHQGQPYIKFQKCFYPIKQVGELSTFYYVKTQEQTYSDPQGFPQSTGQVANSKLFEKVIDINTGKVLDQKRDFKKILAIIKSDQFFKDQKINKKNLAIYITQYNKRNPLFD